MNYRVTRRIVSSRHLAVVRDRRAWSRLGGQLIPLLDRVYAAVKAGRVRQAGHNVFVYRDGAPDGVTAEIGIEAAFPFEEADGIVHSQTPAGDAVSTVHVGGYAGLGDAHDAVRAWCKQHELALANVWWEVYGDWHEDPSQMETEVFYLLRSSLA